MINEFQYRLQKSISEKNITASELSRLSGVGKSDISNYINGVYVAKQDKCFMLAKALGVDPGWLMTGDEPKRVISVTPVGEENELIYQWRKADEGIRSAVRKLLDMKEE